MILRNIGIFLAFLNGLGGAEEFEGCGGERELFGGWFLAGQADELAADGALELLEVSGGFGEDASEAGMVVFLGEESECNVERSYCPVVSIVHEGKRGGLGTFNMAI
jgi:hypothetical protein